MPYLPTTIEELQIILQTPALVSLYEKARDAIRIHNDPQTESFIQRARDQYGSEGSIEIDDDASISTSEDNNGGGYVMGWLYVEGGE